MESKNVIVAMVDARAGACIPGVEFREDPDSANFNFIKASDDVHLELTPLGLVVECCRKLEDDVRRKDEYVVPHHLLGVLTLR